MFRSGYIPFFRLTLFWILGLLIYRINPEPFPLVIPVLYILIGLCIVAYFSFRKVLIAWHRWLLLSIITLSTSFSYVSYINPLKSENHLVHHSSQPSIVKIKNRPEKKGNYTKCLVEIEQLKFQKWTAARGRAYLYVKGHSFLNLAIGQRLHIPENAFKSLSKARNPGEFDYAAYLANKHIYQQAFVDSSEVILLKSPKTKPLMAYLSAYRMNLLATLSFLPNTTRGIAEALLLGYRNNLDEHTSQVFSDTGTMHILAVSGLHVGIIYAVLGFLLAKLIPSSRFRSVRTIATISGLIIYALLTGLPPSVLRATLMFSIFCIGQQVERNTNTSNSLLGSAFILLVADPNLLFNLGFIFSYAAVLGIVNFQPFFANLLSVKSPILRFLWNLTTVSFAAQLATFPLTLLFFHQFPLLFPISNLIAIPAAFITVVLGLIVIFLSFIPLGLLSVSQMIYEFVLDVLLGSLDILSQVSWGKIDEIHLPIWQALFLYLLIFTLFLCWKTKRSFAVWAFSTCFLCLILSSTVQNYLQRQNSSFIVFDVGYKSLYGCRKSDYGFIIGDKTQTRSNAFHTESWFLPCNEVDTSFSSLDSSEIFFSQNLLVTPHFSITINPNTLDEAIDYYVFGSPFDPSNLQKFLPEKCVFDGSIKHEEILQKLPNFEASHFVSRDGYFEIN